MHDKISCADLCGSSVLVGSASGEITRVDLEHMITQKYNIGVRFFPSLCQGQNSELHPLGTYLGSGYLSTVSRHFSLRHW